MKLLYDQDELISTSLTIAKELSGIYDDNVIFHAYWNGTLSEHHYISIQSCWLTNIKQNHNNNKRKIILWIENTTINEWYNKIEEFAEIRIYQIADLHQYLSSPFDTYVYEPDWLPYRANYIRCVLLYIFGGIWFDLDILFTRSFDPIFVNYGNEICLYRWEKESYPNNAIFISLKPFDVRLLNAMKFIYERDKEWGFQQAQLTFDLDIDFLILPCAWFDPSWFNDLKDNIFVEINDENYDPDQFYHGMFCFHWHNKWSHVIEQNCIMRKIIDKLKYIGKDILE